MAQQQPRKPNPASPAPAKPVSTTREPAPSQEVVTRSESAQAVAKRDANLPTYIKQGKDGAGRGSENVEMGDVVIPRIELVQVLSPCLKKDKAEYIEGAKVGDLYNSVTREVYGDRVPVIPVFFKKQYLCWKDRKKGGGFGGAYDSVQEAHTRIAQEPTEEQKLWEATETAQQLVLVVKADGDTEEAIISMARTKMKVSKNWNSLIRLNKNDRFSRFYLLFSADEQNANGDDYKNFAITNGGFPDELHYRKAEALYEAVASGERRVVMDTSDAGDDAGPAPTEY